MGTTGKIVVGVVVPIAAVAIFAILGIWWWRKRKQRKDEEEERRKEVEDYIYNPNAQPTVPAVAGFGPDGSYEPKEDGPGYRGWGTTTGAGGSNGRKASTTMSGGAAGAAAYSDATSPTRGAMSDSGMNGGRYTPEGEILGAMGPPVGGNRGNGGAEDVRRGPSNASSSYSATRSDASGGLPQDPTIGVAYSGSPPGPGAHPAMYHGGYDQYGVENPYVDGQMQSGPYGPPAGQGGGLAPGMYGSSPPGSGQHPSELAGQQIMSMHPSELAGQPIIRDNPARRNTVRIDNPSHYPQQSAGISQNF